MFFRCFPDVLGSVRRALGKKRQKSVTSHTFQACDAGSIPATRSSIRHFRPVKPRFPDEHRISTPVLWELVVFHGMIVPGHCHDRDNFRHAGRLSAGIASAIVPPDDVAAFVQPVTPILIGMTDLANRE